MEKIKIEVTAFGIRHSSVIKSDATAEEFMEKCYLLAEAISYNPSLTREALANSRRNLNKIFFPRITII